MGADGGITWVKVKNKDRFWELIRPFNFCWDDYHSSEHYAFLDENPLDNDCEVMTYGSFQESLCFMDLRDLISVASSYSDYYEIGDDGTFVDILMSLYTMPPWRVIQHDSMMAALEQAVGFKCYGDWNWRTEERSQVPDSLRLTEHKLVMAMQNSILTMPLKKWSYEVKQVIYPNSFGSAETWT